MHPRIARNLALAVVAMAALSALAVVDHLDDPARGQESLSKLDIGVPGFRFGVIDGDTVDLGRERIRISNLDAPEMPNKARCATEARKALEARAWLAATLTKPGALVLVQRDRKRPVDRYGRTLARLSINGADVGSQMVAEGLARPWRGKSSDWCSGAP